MLIESRMSVQEIEDRQPDIHAKATVCITNHIVEITVIEKRSSLLHDYQRLNGYEYLDKRTGEIKRYSENATPNKNRSYTKLRRYINTNFTGQDNELFLTLTYANPEFNRSQVSHDFRNFWKKFKYHHNSCEYIAIFEPHKSGAWHIHILIKDLQKKYLFVDYEECKKLWSHGNICLLKLKDNDNIGAYFTALQRRNEQEVSGKKSRIQYYPKNAKVFTHSKKIRKPYFKTMTYEDALKMVEHSTKCFTRTLGIFENGKEVNSIFYQQFNKFRKDE